MSRCHRRALCAAALCLFLAASAIAEPTRAPFEHCAHEGAQCSCDGAVRFGYELESGETDIVAYKDVKCSTFECRDWRPESERHAPAGAVKGKCECSAEIIPPPPPEENLDYKWCSTPFHGEPCKCKGRMRIGATGLRKHYENDSAFFKANPDLVRHVSVDVPSGSYPCDLRSFPDREADPWAGHPEMQDHMICQCAELPYDTDHLCVLAPPSPDAPMSPPPAPEAPGVPQPPTAPEFPPAPKPPHPTFPPPNPEPPTFPPVPDEVPDLVYIEPEMLDEPGDPPELPEYRDPVMVEKDTKAAELMEEVSIDVLPGVKPWLVRWEHCADDGEDCDCGGTIRYGHAGYRMHYENDGEYFKENPHVIRWLMRMGNEDGSPTPCNVKHFGDRDPFPDIPEEDKVCLCAEKVKPYQYKITGVTWGQTSADYGAFFEPSHKGGKYEKCAEKGEFCECDGTVRIGQPSYAVPQEAYPAFWKEIFIHHDDLHKVQGRWFLRAPDAAAGGVQCVKENFMTVENTKRVTDATVDDAVTCQCLAGGPGHHAEFYPEGVVDEVQLISLDDITPRTDDDGTASFAPVVPSETSTLAKPRGAAGNVGELLALTSLAEDEALAEMMTAAKEAAALGKAPKRLKVPRVAAVKSKSGKGSRASKATHAPKAEARASKAEARASKAEARASKAEARASKAEAHSSKAEAHASKKAARASMAEPHSSKAEAHASKKTARASKGNGNGHRLQVPAAVSHPATATAPGTTLKEALLALTRGRGDDPAPATGPSGPLGKRTEASGAAGPTDAPRMRFFGASNVELAAATAVLAAAAVMGATVTMMARAAARRGAGIRGSVETLPLISGDAPKGARR